MNRILALAILGTVLLSGCGGSKLTDEQRAQFKELTKNASSVISSSKGGVKAIRAAGATTASSELQTRIAAKLASPSCKTSTPDMTSATIKTLSIKVEGDDCPLAMEVSITGDEKAPKIKIYFEIKDAELLALSDVSKMDLAGSLSASGGTMTGAIQSKKFGRVGLNFDISANGNGGKAIITYAFPTFDVKIGIEGSDGKIKYTLNGKEISEKELQDLIQDGGLVPGLSGGTPVSSGTSGGGSVSGSSSFSYSLNYNNCPTGEQSFTSLEAMCTGLQSKSLNNNCALNLRKAKFAAECDGTFAETP